MDRHATGYLIRARTEPGARRYRFLASNDSLDRQGERIARGAWVLDAYRKNPIVLVHHDYRSLPVGRTVSIFEDERGLVADIEFDDQDPTARLVESKVQRGFLNAISVGFRSLETRPDPTDRTVLVHTRAELLEVSLVAVPANPEALVLQRALQHQLAVDVMGIQHWIIQHDVARLRRMVGALAGGSR
jgi:HK97 family phage prohead protease